MDTYTWRTVEREVRAQMFNQNHERMLYSVMNNVSQYNDTSWNRSVQSLHSHIWSERSIKSYHTPDITFECVHKWIHNIIYIVKPQLSTKTYTDCIWYLHCLAYINYISTRITKRNFDLDLNRTTVIRPSPSCYFYRVDRKQECWQESYFLSCCLQFSVLLLAKIKLFITQIVVSLGPASSQTTLCQKIHRLVSFSLK